ncbi:MAG: LysE family transporter [Anaerolineae bacterium]
MLLYFLQGLTWGMSATATPGPFQAFLLAQTLQNGWKRTWPASFAPLLSDGPIIALVLWVLVQTPAWLLNILQVAGGLFILYLVFEMLTSLQKGQPTLVASTQASRQSFFKAVLMNALSPGPYLFWSIIAGPLVLQGWQQSPVTGLSFVVGFYLALIGGTIGVITLFATASRFGPQASYLLKSVSALALLGFGVYQLWAGVVSLTT